MDIKLIPVEGGERFTFSILPEEIKGRSAAKHQSIDIISKGTIKIPKGTDVTTYSWDCVFFGETKRHESMVKSDVWRDPIECVNLLMGYMEQGTLLNLIVTDTWINVDVTISSFQAIPYGAFGNVKYSIEFVVKTPIEIYTTKEIKISNYSKKTKSRNNKKKNNKNKKGSYTVKSGDTLWSIAAKHCGGGKNWTKLYKKNKAVIENTAKKHGKKSSDNGRFIWSGEVLILV